MKHKFFVTGTDTEVGKTWITCALLEAFNQRGYRTAGMKPVAAGSEKTAQGFRNEDALAIQAAMSLELPYDQINPVCMEPAIAPHIAIALAKKNITVSALTGYCNGLLTQGADITLIEGAGGWRVPLNSRETLADLAKQLNIAVILVVGVRLGCLNHAFLTLEAIQRDGLSCAGWVANVIDSKMPYLRQNIDTLKSAIPHPCLGEVPHLSNASFVDAVKYLSPELLVNA